MDEIWAAIELHAGQPFHLVRGGEFTYRVDGAHVLPDRTHRQLHKSQFKTALERMPVTGPGDLQDLQGPSYLYAILTDSRIGG